SIGPMAVRPSQGTRTLRATGAEATCAYIIGMAFDRLSFFLMMGASKPSILVGASVLLFHTAAAAQQPGQISTEWPTQASATAALIAQPPEPAPAPEP